MSFTKNLLTHKYFPLSSREIPFGKILNSIFFEPISDNRDYPLHGPNVIRFIEAFMTCRLDNEVGLLKKDCEEARNTYLKYYPEIIKSMDIDLESSDGDQEKNKMLELLKVAAMEIGDVID
jgi:hypothetical protein